jgi:hypothetical protein
LNDRLCNRGISIIEYLGNFLIDTLSSEGRLTGLVIGFASPFIIDAILSFIDGFRAKRDLAVLRKEIKKHKVVDMDVAIYICKSLTEIQTKYGERISVEVLVTDSQGIPARLKLSQIIDVQAELDGIRFIPSEN